MASGVEVFFSYAPADEEWRIELEKHLSLLQRKGLIATWHKRNISAGAERAREIDTHLQTSQIILLLISADFLASDFCWSVELQEAMRRHHAATACVIPILIRQVDLKDAPFSQLQVLPRDNRAVTSWPNRDEAFTQVAEGIRQAIAEWEVHRNVTFASSLPFLSMPHERNPLFTGREDVLERLHQALHAGKTTALTQRQAISGLGGIGKTQTAVEYAYRYQGDYQVIAWVKADVPETLATEFVTLARLLNLPIMQEQDQTFIIESVKRWFHEHSGWLLIFDNADDLLMVGNLCRRWTACHWPSTRPQPILKKRAAACPTTSSSTRRDRQTYSNGAANMRRTIKNLLLLRGPFLLRRCNRRMLALPIFCASLIDTWEMTFPKATGLLMQAAKYLYDHADYLQAESLLQRALDIYERVPGPDHPNTASALNNLALLYQDMGQDEKAEPLYQRALDIHERMREPDHPEIATTLNNLAGLYQATGQNERAELLYQRAMDIRERVLDSNHPDTATTLNNLAELYRNMGQYEKAEPLYQRALAINERVLGPDYPLTATILNNLALLYQATGQYEKAEPLHVRDLNISERVLGPDHPDTATTLNNLALLYQDMGQYEKAEPLFQRSLDIRERVLGPDHPHMAFSLSHLAGLYQDMGLYEKAELLQLRAQRIRDKRKK